MHQEAILTFISYYLRSKFYKAIALVVKTNKQTNKNLPANAGDVRDGFDPWIGKIPWGRKWQPSPKEMATLSSILVWKSHEQRTLESYSP